MKALSMRAWLLIALSALVALNLAAAGPGTVSGVVRDPSGMPIEAARVTLASAENSSTARQTQSDIEGKYQFSGVALGPYRLSVEISGYAAVKPTPIAVSSERQNVSLDFVLARLSAEAAIDSSAQAQSPPKFESAGVRGLIDPGGYSAPANAAAASGLIKGVADIERADNASAGAAAAAWPCSLEHELKKSAEANPRDSVANRRLGEFYLAHGQATQAIPYFQRTSQLDGTDLVAAKDLAKALLQTEQFAAALRLLRTLTERQNDPEIHQLLARAEEGSGQFKQAAQEYKLAANKSPNEETLLGVGYELILAGQAADAAFAFQSATKQFPHSVTLLIGAGTAEFLQGKTAEALNSFLLATEIDPSDSRAYPFLASTSQSAGSDSEKVRASFKRFLEVAPNNPQASYYYALSLWNSRAQSASPSDRATIEALLKRAIQLDPNYAEAHFELASLYFERSDFLQAIQEFETTLRLAPDTRDVHYRLASAYRHTGQMEQAARELRLFEESHEKDTAASGAPAISITQFVSVIGTKGSDIAASRSCTQSQP